MAVYNVELRRSNGSNYDDKIYVKTSVGLVEGLLDGDEKIRASLLPSFVFGGMRFVTSISQGMTTAELQDIFSEFIDTNGGTMRGCYAIATNYIVIEISEGHTFVGLEEGDIPDPSLEDYGLEPNDWIIAVDDNGTTWAIINNTYRDATTTTRGIVQLATEQDGINGTSSTLAMTPKATVAAINARAYSHPTYLTESFYVSGTNKIITNLVIKNGHIQSMSSGFISHANEIDAGLIRLATSAEAKVATTGDTAISPRTAKEMIDRFASIELVQSLPTDMSDHPAGKLILLQI